jgi:membrane protease YdiL (CAAX protease family)
MNQPTKEWIKKNPIATFFAIAIAISFGTLFPAIYIIPNNNTIGQIIGYYLARIGTYSPFIAAILVTRIIHSDRPRIPFSQRLKVSIPVWLIAVIINLASLKLTAPSGASLIGLIILSLPVALLPAWAISSAFSGTIGVRKMLITLLKPRGGITYYLIALFTFPVIQIAGAVITNAWNGSALFPQINLTANLVLTLTITFFSVLLFSGGLNEESGWRGFAQIRLQASYSPLVTVIILWCLMVIWHIPNDIIQYQNGGYLLMRIGLYPFITILFSWIFNRTNGNIWPVAIFHASMNSMNPLMGIFPVTTVGNVMLVMFAVVVIIVDRMWRKLPKDHSSVYKEIINNN